MASLLERRERWQELIEDYGSSGETVASWCQFNSVSVHSFYYWKKKLAQPKQSSRAYAPQRPPSGAVGADTSWLRLDAQSRRLPALSSPALTLTVGSISVRVEPGFDPTFLSDVLSVLVGLEAASSQRDGFCLPDAGTQSGPKIDRPKAPVGLEHPGFAAHPMRSGVRTPASAVATGLPVERRC